MKPKELTKELAYINKYYVFYNQAIDIILASGKFKTEGSAKTKISDWIREGKLYKHPSNPALFSKQDLLTIVNK